MGVQAVGQIPHAGNAGMGVQAVGQIPHAGNAGMGQDPIMLTSSGRTALRWLRVLSDRLERVRMTHGDWSRCLNHHYGGSSTAILLDPPYRGYDKLYGTEADTVADKVASWARDNHQGIRVALCGHVGDYELPGWDCVPWDRGRLTYGGDKTTDQEAVWFSPGCIPAKKSKGLWSSR